MSNVVVDFQQTTDHTMVDGSIQNIQIDNQLYEAQFPVILCLTPAKQFLLPGHTQDLEKRY